MKSLGINKIDEGAWFVVDTLAYMNQITYFDLGVATQTISSGSMEIQAPEFPSTPAIEDMVSAFSLAMRQNLPKISTF